MDSSFIESQTSTKNKKKERDPEAHSAKKGNQWHFGYKTHIAVDKKTGLIHTNITTSANVHDVTVTGQLLLGTEEEVYGDSGYLGQKREKSSYTQRPRTKNQV